MSNFHGRLMNIPARAGQSSRLPGYYEGHRDARHAAAEIGLEADALAARLASVERERDEIMAMAERREGKLQARLAEAEAALSLASQAIDERLSGLAGDPLQPVADAINRYFAPDSACPVHKQHDPDCPACPPPPDSASGRTIYGYSVSDRFAAEEAAFKASLNDAADQPSSSADVERRPCTCPDGERPIPCPRKFSVSECQTAAGWTDSASEERHPGYIIGYHWLEVAYQRVCAGEDEKTVLEDYGYARADQATERQRDVCETCGTPLWPFLQCARCVMDHPDSATEGEMSGSAYGRPGYGDEGCSSPGSIPGSSTTHSASVEGEK